MYRFTMEKPPFHSKELEIIAHQSIDPNQLVPQDVAINLISKFFNCMRESLKTRLISSIL